MNVDKARELLYQGDGDSILYMYRCLTLDGDPLVVNMLRSWLVTRVPEWSLGEEISEGIGAGTVAGLTYTCLRWLSVCSDNMQYLVESLYVNSHEKLRCAVMDSERIFFSFEVDSEIGVVVSIERTGRMDIVLSSYGNRHVPIYYDINRGKLLHDLNGVRDVDVFISSLEEVARLMRKPHFFSNIVMELTYLRDSREERELSSFRWSLT